MKLEEYDGVHLNREVEELAACGIYKGCRGVIIKLGEKRSLVLFYNPEDLGDYAYAWANNDDLEYYRKLLDHIKKEMMQKMATEDFTKKLRFEETHLLEYDSVKVLVEKEQYARKSTAAGWYISPMKQEPTRLHTGSKKRTWNLFCVLESRRCRA